MLFVEPNEREVKELLSWRRRVWTTHLGNEHWLLSPLVVFESTKSQESLERVLIMYAEFNTLAAAAMQYIYYSRPQLPNFLLGIEARRPIYHYRYGSWCAEPILPINTCMARNDYYFYSLGKPSLKPPPSLRTVVPTQLSGLV